jgi:hypothetical protein
MLQPLDLPYKVIIANVVVRELNIHKNINDTSTSEGIRARTQKCPIQIIPTTW